MPQMSLRKCAVSLESLLLAQTKYGSRRSSNRISACTLFAWICHSRRLVTTLKSLLNVRFSFFPGRENKGADQTARLFTYNKNAHINVRFSFFNKGADQTVRMRRLVCAFVVHIQQKTAHA